MTNNEREEDKNSSLSVLTITYECDFSENIDETLIYDYCEKIYSGESINSNRVVDLIFCTEQTIQQLNNNFRNKNKITDVLSFPFPNEIDYLGEIYICIPRANEQRIDYNLTLNEEILRLFIHGLFHLQGFDHEDEFERQIMEAKEKKYIDFDS